LNGVTKATVNPANFSPRVMDAGSGWMMFIGNCVL